MHNSRAHKFVSNIGLHRAPARPGLTITFRREAPVEEVVDFVRYCAARLRERANELSVVLERRIRSYEVQLRADAGHAVVESDPDVFLAVRNAFARLQEQVEPGPGRPLLS